MKKTGLATPEIKILHLSQKHHSILQAEEIHTLYLHALVPYYTNTSRSQQFNLHDFFVPPLCSLTKGTITALTDFSLTWE